ncbi:MAG: acyl-CoA dehydrogenase family protein, partial [Chloroflexi bacterium]|nr:acyl-CoA dehydrogenase family protein [Chloroflexota bacterium]
MPVRTPPEIREQIVATVRDFVKRDVLPVAQKLELADEYPHELVEKMKEMGLFGITIPPEYGGQGLDYTTFAMIFEELCKGWMSVSGIIGTHHVMAYAVMTFGTEEQKRKYLPAFARGEKRGGLALSEPDAGTDVQAIKTTARRDGDHYVVNGQKMWITNSYYGNTFLLIAKTDPKAQPAHRGISAFVAEKGPGFNVVGKISKLGYRGVDTCPINFEDYRVPVTNLVGGVEGEGFKHVMSALETGRINIAARAVGVATAAFEAAIKYAQRRHTMGKPIAEHQAIQLKLADMATRIQAARLLTHWAAEVKDRGERSD